MSQAPFDGRHLNGVQGQSRLPLLERETALAALARAWQGAASGSGRVVLIAGEAGIGKSSLLRAFLEDVAADDTRKLVTRSYEHESAPPYEPWSHLLCEEPELRAMVAKPLGTRTPAAHGAVDLARQTATAVLELARERPVILAFDDLHLTDESSLALLRAVAQRVAGAPALLLLAFRTPIEDGSPLAAFVPVAIREGPTEYLDLTPLSESAIRRFIDGRYADLPAREREDLGRELARLSGGNGLFLSELLSAIEAPDAAAGGSPRERLHRLPVTLRQIIDYQAGRLSPEAQETLRLAALVGEAMNLDLLAELRQRDHEEVLRHLEEALARGLLVEARTGETRFRHGVVRQALVEGQSMLRRRRQHARVLDALRKRPSSPITDLAFHAEMACDLAAACEALAQAGQRAVRVFALPEAVQFFRRALALAEQANLDPVQEDEIRLALVDSILRNDRGAAAREAERVAARALARDDRLTLARARQRLATLAYEGGRRGDTKALLDPSIPELEQTGDKTTLAEALSCLGYCYSSESDFVNVEKTARRLLALTAELGDQTYRAVSLYLMAIALIARGEPEQAPEMMRESIAILAELGRLDIATGFAVVAFTRVDLFANLHRPEMVADLIRLGERLDDEGDRRLGLPPGRCTIEFSYWRFLRGAWDEARGFLPDPLAIREHAWPQVRKDMVHTIAAEFAIAEGRLADAESLLGYIAPSPTAPLGEHSYQQWLLALERIIMLRILRGDLPRAREWLRAFDRALEERPHVPGELLLDLSAARLTLADGQPEAALPLIDGVVERAGKTQNMLALIAALRLKAEALRALGRMADAIQAATQAIVEGERGELAYEAALSLLTRAEVGYGVASLDEPARADLAQAIAVFEQLGARGALERATRLTRRSRRGWPSGLTDREVAVLRLVARGFSDRQIGESLFISPRTVSTHISNMLVKTDSTNRVDLTAWALANGIVTPESAR